MSIGRLFGVRIVLNPYFLLLMLALGVGGFLWETLILFGVVFLHELAHVVTAKASGLTVREVELLPFGGVARIDDVIEFDPSVEISVALAGPLTNAFLYGLALWLAGRLALPPERLDLFLKANLSIGLFNLIPALPLDGGRMLRSVLSRRIGFRRATDWAASMGKACALVGGGIGCYLVFIGVANISVLVLAVFVYLSAGKEQGLAAYVFMRYLTRKQRELERNRSLVAHQLVALEATPIKDVMHSFVPQKYHVIWILDAKGRLVGMTTELELIEATFQSGARTPIGDVARRVD